MTYLFTPPATGQFILPHRFMHCLDHHAHKEPLKILGGLSGQLGLLLTRTARSVAELAETPRFFSGIIPA